MAEIPSLCSGQRGCLSRIWAWSDVSYRIRVQKLEVGAAYLLPGMVRGAGFRLTAFPFAQQASWTVAKPFEDLDHVHQTNLASGPVELVSSAATPYGGDESSVTQLPQQFGEIVGRNIAFLGEIPAQDGPTARFRGKADERAKCVLGGGRKHGPVVQATASLTTGKSRPARRSVINPLGRQSGGVTS